MKMCNAAVVCGVALSTGVAFGNTIAAEFMPDEWGFSGPIGYVGGNVINSHHGQGFLSVKRGPVTSLTMNIYRRTGATQPLTVEMYSPTGAGAPGTLLGSVNIDASVFPEGVSNITTMDVSGLGVNVVPGQEYVFVLGVDTPAALYPYDVIGGTLSDESYEDGIRVYASDGENYLTYSTTDWGFRVEVPAPGTASVLAIAGLAGTRRRPR